MKATLLRRNKKLESSKSRLKNFKQLKNIEKKTLELKDVLKKATANMYLQPTRKYGVPPEHVGKKPSKIEEYRLTYDFSHLKKVDKDADRYSKYDRRSDKKAKRNYVHR